MRMWLTNDQEAQVKKFEAALSRLPERYEYQRKLARAVYRQNGFMHAMETVNAWLDTLPAWEEKR